MSTSPWTSTTQNPGPFEKMTTVQKRKRLPKTATVTLLRPLQPRRAVREDRKARSMEMFEKGALGLNVERGARQAKEKDLIGLQLHMRRGRQ